MLEAGRTFGRYRIEAPLGVGGMGVVYRAFDTLLRREVALKVLSTSEDPPQGVRPPAGTRTDEARARLLREARAAAALRHPCAVSVFDVGEVEETPFIAMELVLGRPLRSWMREGGVALETKVRWLVSIADVLDAAHAVDLVHRDIKPENVMVCPDGSIKVLDFGIAKRTTRTSDEDGDDIADRASAPPSFRTKEGTISGTPSYMAPEQKTGGAIDARTDQYSWGVVACELVCGTHPRKADLSEILDEARDEVDPTVLDVIERALSGRPSDRFASMREIVSRLTPIAGASSPALPSSDPGPSLPAEATNDATEPIASAFTRTDETDRVPERDDAPAPAPRAPSETSGSKRTPAPAGWSTGRKAAVAIVAIAAAATSIGLVSKQRGSSPPAPIPSASGPAKHTVPANARATYLRGRYFWTQRTGAGLTKAIEHYEEAVKIDPEYADAYVGIAESYLILPYMSTTTDAEAESHVRPALDKALALEPNNAAAHCARAYEHLEYHWAFAKSEAEFKRSLELDPDNAVTHQWYGELLDYLARHDEAVAQMKRALELDPVSVPVMKNYGMILLHARRFTEAEAILRRTIEMDTKQPYLHLHLATTLAELGRYDEAIKECRIEAEGTGDSPLARSGETVSELYVAARTGKKDVVAKHLATLEGAKLLELNAFLAAYVYGLAGVREKMYEELERAIRERARWTLMMNFSPAFDAYRKEPRFQELRRRIGFPD